ncbi:MAG TPA: pectinesterase family protein [Phycisphaerae bacterium]|nr:pectinesterase family protein [Phycisphaerae bacterium]
MMLKAGAVARSNMGGTPMPRLVAVLIALASAGVAWGEIPVMFPAGDAKNVCVDTPLRLTFAGKPKVGVGEVKIVDANGDKVVDTIDVAQAKRVIAIGGVGNFSVLPVIVTGNTAAIYPVHGALAYGHRYYVTMDAGTFTDAEGTEFPAIGKGAWEFSTKGAAPAFPPAGGKVTVAADGTGDFATVQGAIDFVPDGNKTPVTLFVRAGTYDEINVMVQKNDVTLLGEDRKKTIIEYPNNAKFNSNENANPYANGANPTTRRMGNVYHRGMFLAHRCNDLTIANLTLHNTTPQGGSQAEALILNGTANAHAIVANCDLYSYQDTVQINGQAYVTGCHIEGDVDFIWGTGPCFFEKCDIVALRKNAYYTQIRNPATHHGYVFKDCTFEGAEGVTGNMLARIEPTRFPGSEVVLIDCTLTDAVSPVAWRIERATEAPEVHFWEYNSHDASGKPVDTSQRLGVGKVLTQEKDAETIKNYSDPKWVLGGEWEPAVPAEVKE